MRRLTLRDTINLRAAGYTRHPITPAEQWTRDIEERERQRAAERDGEQFQRRGEQSQPTRKRGLLTRIAEALANALGFQRRRP